VAIRRDCDAIEVEPALCVTELRERLSQPQTPSGLELGPPPAQTVGKLRPGNGLVAKMPSLDTNCLLRWLLGDVPGQTARMDRMLAEGGPLHVPDVVLLEAVFVLEKVEGLAREDVAAAIRTVLAEAALVVDRGLWAELTDLHLAHRKLSAADIYLVFDARLRRREPLLTFYKKLASQLPGTAAVP
jgi:predicted nucleic-acid-binding protein